MSITTVDGQSLLFLECVVLLDKGGKAIDNKRKEMPAAGGKNRSSDLSDSLRERAYTGNVGS